MIPQALFSVSSVYVDRGQQTEFANGLIGVVVVYVMTLLVGRDAVGEAERGVLLLWLSEMVGLRT
jgi:hypothetical protein